MVGTAWLAPLAGSGIVRRMTDAAFVRYAHRRVKQLDRMDVAAVQQDTLLRLVRRAADTRFGRDHDFAAVRSVADFQQRVPVRDYEAFWQEYWKDTYPRLQGVTWPDAIPYYALSSGTTTGATKFLPVSWDMVKSNRKAAATTILDTGRAPDKVLLVRTARWDVSLDGADRPGYYFPERVDDERRLLVWIGTRDGDGYWSRHRRRHDRAVG